MKVNCRATCNSMNLNVHTNSMNELLFLIPALPFAGFLVLALAGRRLSKATVALVGAGSVGLSALLTMVMAIEFIGSQGEAFTQTLWTWMQFDGYLGKHLFHP